MLIHTGEDTVQLVFTTATLGVETGDSDSSSFVYTYQKKSATAASLVVRFKADRWDEYDLVYTVEGRGTLVLRQYKSNILERTRTGSFGTTSTH